MKFASTIAVLALVLCVSPAGAQSAADRFRECRSGEGQKAIDACTWYLSAGYNPSAQNRAFTLELRGYAEQKLKRFDAALADFAAAIDLEPASPELRELHAHAAEALGRNDLAMADYDSLIASDPSNTHWYNNRCYVRASAGKDLDKALADCERSLTLDPSNWAAQDSRCFVRYRLGDYAGAVADCDAVLAGHPDVAPSLYVRGLARLRLGQTGLGQADIDRAKVEQPGIDVTFAADGVTP